MGSSARPQSHVIGPDGTILTCANLPPRNTRRWVPRRKAEVIAAVDGGLITLSDACTRYEISQEEFRAWVQAYARLQLLRPWVMKSRGKKSRLVRTRPVKMLW